MVNITTQRDSLCLPTGLSTRISAALSPQIREKHVASPGSKAVSKKRSGWASCDQFCFQKSQGSQPGTNLLDSG